MTKSTSKKSIYVKSLAIAFNDRLIEVSHTDKSFVDFVVRNLRHLVCRFRLAGFDEEVLFVSLLEFVNQVVLLKAMDATDAEPQDKEELVAWALALAEDRYGKWNRVADGEDFNTAA